MVLRRSIIFVAIVNMALQAAGVNVVQVNPSGTYKTVRWNTVEWNGEVPMAARALNSNGYHRSQLRWLLFLMTLQLGRWILLLVHTLSNFPSLALVPLPCAEKPMALPVPIWTTS
jgi:hypothetical protein